MIKIRTKADQVLHQCGDIIGKKGSGKSKNNEETIMILY